MNRLQIELQRLYVVGRTLAEQGEPRFSDDEGRVRTLVLELARPADWPSLALLWHGVQDDLGLPAPAIAVNGVDGYQLWFSLSEPVHAAEGRRLIDRLRRRYLREVAPARVAIVLPPATEMVPALKAASGQWSAFIARDLAAVFADEPWLDMRPSPEAQADVLSRLKSIKLADFQSAFDQLAPFGEGGAHPPLAVIEGDRGQENTQRNVAAKPGAGPDPKRFLLDAMSDTGLDMHLRIEAARALLPYFEKPRDV